MFNIFKKKKEIHPKVIMSKRVRKITNNLYKLVNSKHLRLNTNKEDTLVLETALGSRTFVFSDSNFFSSLKMVEGNKVLFHILCSTSDISWSSSSKKDYLNKLLVNSLDETSPNHNMSLHEIDLALLELEGKINMLMLLDALHKTTERLRDSEGVFDA